MKLGAEVVESEDGLTIKANALKNASLDAHDDHRLFMAFCIASMLTEKSVVDGLESVDVSYPTFVDDLRGLGAEIRAL
jgi:3-phosphoshikimate 1-carboxyvinyltransferase